MSHSILQSSVSRKGLTLDPRTKLFVLLTLSFFVLGGVGSSFMQHLFPVFAALPALLLFTSGKIKRGIIYVVLYGATFLMSELLLPHMSGFSGYLMLALCGILTRLMPSIMMGAYLMTTTTVSEFTAAMQRMHLSEKIIIPLSVMFRFFPTVFDEAASISAAMRMRDIRFGGKNAGKMLEYRLVPLMTCCVKIGEELSAAALTRGLGGEVKRTNVCRIGFKLQDYIFFGICIVPYVLVVLDMIGLWR